MPPNLMLRHNSENGKSGACSNALSHSACPDEDWAKVKDPAERRRIQNRLSQRTYRKKWRKRLLALEMRAGTSDELSSPADRTKKQKPRSQSAMKISSPKSSQNPVQQPPSTQAMNSDPTLMPRSSTAAYPKIEAEIDPYLLGTIFTRTSPPVTTLGDGHSLPIYGPSTYGWPNVTSYSAKFVLRECPTPSLASQLC
ncbi:hypothetical protein F5Y19DRAFT_446349 [Xylariaceae sp. FL1651]|nr:hypothetical protein F5Y19DRAFT_446349 [Xylariaceae sp. FL1651]